jgi:hypothetical protein
MSKNIEDAARKEKNTKYLPNFSMVAGWDFPCENSQQPSQPNLFSRILLLI